MLPPEHATLETDVQIQHVGERQPGVLAPYSSLARKNASQERVGEDASSCQRISESICRLLLQMHLTVCGRCESESSLNGLHYFQKFLPAPQCSLPLTNA